MEINKPGLVSKTDTKDDKMYFLKVTAVILVITFLYLPTFYFTGAFFSFKWLLIVTLCTVPSLFALYMLDFSFLPRFIMLLGCNAGVFLTSLGLRHEINSQQYVFAFMILSLLLFNQKNKSLVVFGGAISLINGWLIFNKAFLEYAQIPVLVNVPIHELSLMNFLGTSVMVAAFVYLFIEDSHRQQLRIAFLLGTSNINFRALKEKESELEQVTQAIEQNACLAVIDPSGKIKRVNKFLCDLCGFTEDQMVGEYYRNIFQLDHFENYVEEIKSALNSGKSWRGYIENIPNPKAGKNFKLKIVVAPVKNMDGEIEKFVAIGFDSSN